MLRQLANEAPQLLPLLGRAIAEKSVAKVGFDVYKQLKDKFRAAGCGDSGWKFLLKMPASTIQWLASTYALQQIIPIVAMLAETGVVPLKGLLQHWVYAMHYSHQLLPPVWFRRAAASYAQTLSDERAVQRFIGNEYTVAMQWLLTQALVPDIHQARAGWSWIRRQAEGWKGGTRWAARNSGPPWLRSMRMPATPSCR